MPGLSGSDRIYENQSAPLRSRPDDARHLSGQAVAKTAKIRRIPLREIASVSSMLGLPLCTYQQNCKSLATRLRLETGLYFTKLRHLSRFTLALVSFGAADPPLQCEYQRRYRRAPQGAPDRPRGFSWCATLGDKQTSTERRDVRCSLTCRLVGLILQRRTSCSLSVCYCLRLLRPGF